MGQPDHLGRVTQSSLWFQATHPEITSTRCPSCYSPVDVSSHCVVQHRAKTAAEAGRGRPELLAGATGPAPPSPRLWAWVPAPEKPGQGGEERWHGRPLTFSPFQWPRIAGETGGDGQPAAESENFLLPEPAAGCHLGRGSASFPNLPSLWKTGRKLCAGEIASPSILRLSVKNPTKPAFEKKKG